MAPLYAEQFRIVFLVISGALSIESLQVPAHFESNRACRMHSVTISPEKGLKLLFKLLIFGHIMECKCCLYLLCEFGEVSWSYSSVQNRSQVSQQMSRPGSRLRQVHEVRNISLIAKSRHTDNVPYC